jgi:hypothetical protein
MPIASSPYSPCSSFCRYAKFEWDKLLERQVQSPWKPPIKSATDTSHFDPYEEDEDEFSEPYHDDGSGWDDAF